MPNGTIEFTEYACTYSVVARRGRERCPKDMLPKLLAAVDDLAKNPDGFPEQTHKLGKGPSGGELCLYAHPELPLEVTYEVDRQNRRLYLVHFSAPISELKPVFVSYSHADKQWLDQLRTFLKPLERQGLVRIWDDTNIHAGSKWREEIEKSLESAKMAVLLVTQQFLDSPFILGNEIPPLLTKAEQQGLKVIWIAVKASTVEHSPIYQFQAANDPAHPLETLDEPQRNKVLVEIYKRIKEAAEA
ncbi:MAG TPA: toll/interleukin-1 receptor domain-containing protein [Candidatus Solibacter sp.]|nr:toll/interleukin-1 receptor domain-containing protein [Candidatus Solibacter sp.]